MEDLFVIVDINLCENECDLVVDWPNLMSILILCSVIIGIAHHYCKPKRYQEGKNTIQNVSEIIRCEQMVEISYGICMDIIPKLDFDLNEDKNRIVLARIEINRSLDQIISLDREQTLICYCDGSYSHYMQIGYAGFRTFNGVNRIRLSYPANPRCGSTSTEVFAAYLAIQYALEKQYKTLMIYTDNSKVEQLLKCRKKKDMTDYPDICQILDQYQTQNGNDSVSVIRVRGHTSISEQRKCHVKCHFAKIDRIVRRKTRRFIKRWWINWQQYYDIYQPVYHSHHTYRSFHYYFQYF